MYLEDIALIVICFYFTYIFYEKYRHGENLKKIPLIIHVNGIRGKSAVSRLIDAGLRGSGLRVFTKVTGTKSIYIDTSGKEYEIKRRGRATIREQLRVIKRAAREKPDVLIMECMAIDPKLQKVLQEKIVKSKLSIITNVRRDHLLEMGPSLWNVAKSLGAVVPSNGTLILGEDKFKDLYEEMCEERESILKIAKGNTVESKIDFPENISIALEVCDCLNLDRDIFIESMEKNYKKDVGKFKLISLNERIIADGLAINDTDSIEKVYNLIKEEYSNVSLLICSRSDRLERGLEIIEWAKNNSIKRIFLSGKGVKILKKNIDEKRVEIIVENEIEEIIKCLSTDEVLFMVGNIKGTGEKILEKLIEKGEVIG